MNKAQPHTGDALRSFGKLLANASFGQSIKEDKNTTQQLVRSKEDCTAFLQENKLKNCIFISNDYDLLIGEKKIDMKEYFTSRSSAIGVYVLSYSRYMIQLFNMVINPE